MSVAVQETAFPSRDALHNELRIIKKAVYVGFDLSVNLPRTENKMNVVVEFVWLLCRIVFYCVESLYRLLVRPHAKTIAGKVALVTGAGRGIGREIALALVKRGVRVALCDINEAECVETARIITESGKTARAYRCDVTSVEQVANMAAKVRRELGGVDILVNNAGVLNVKTILKLSDDEIKRTMNVNAVAQFWTVREFLPSMITNKCGHIVVISSIAGQATAPLVTDYCASKFAAHGFGEALRDDLRYMNVTGVDVTTVYPTFVDTRMVLDLKDRIAVHNRFQPKNLTPEQVAEATVDGILYRQLHVFIPSYLKLFNSLTR